ncbi:hypothetical protein IM40_08260 [Candidatus Paracaedimonas acanthamoebae]|nr:hypothetical protein IM40_08260 [Candidatus Paracaedimonas acanthamoebae]
MQIFWTLSAQLDLENIFDYIFQQNPQAAHRIYEEIQTKIGMLSDSPYEGKTSKISNTKELVFSELPYTAIYRILQVEIQILRLLHGA